MTSEADFQRQVVKLAERHGWLVCHVRRAQVRPGRHVTPTSAPGFPDLVLVKPPRVVFLELKAEGGRPSHEQVQWIGKLQRCTEVEAYFAKPSDGAVLHQLLTEPPSPVHE